MASLEVAVARGFGTLAILDDNEDFASLRTRSDWAALRARVADAKTGA
jgi:hypothetical protein